MNRPKLCTVVCLSNTPPDPVMPYHMQINLAPALPNPWNSNGVWVKGDMVYSIGFQRLDFIRLGKQANGKRIYYYSKLNDHQMKQVHACVLRGMGLSSLTKHL